MKKPIKDKIRTCPVCNEQFTWREKKYGQIYCSAACSRSIPNGGGRPTTITEETIKKLEEVFSLDGTLGEACFYANISHQTYYNILDKKPELVERFKALRQKPFLLARKTIVQNLNNPQYAFEYMKRKKKDEFSERNEVTGAEGEAININLVNYAANNPPPIQTERVSSPDTQGA